MKTKSFLTPKQRQQAEKLKHALGSGNLDDVRAQLIAEAIEEIDAAIEQLKETHPNVTTLTLRA